MTPTRKSCQARTNALRYAKATFRKDRRLNTRLSSKDLKAIQRLALAEGLPYQTLISSLLHKYAAGRLKDVCTARACRSPRHGGANAELDQRGATAASVANQPIRQHGDAAGSWALGEYHTDGGVHQHGESAQRSSLSGPPITAFKTREGTGLQIDTTLTIGYFWRF